MNIINARDARRKAKGLLTYDEIRELINKRVIAEADRNHIDDVRIAVFTLQEKIPKEIEQELLTLGYLLYEDKEVDSITNKYIYSLYF